MKFAQNRFGKSPSFVRLILIWLVVILLLVWYWGTAVPTQASTISQTPLEVATLVAQAQEAGGVRVIVQLDLPFRPEGDLDNSQAVQAQQVGIDSLQSGVVNALADSNVEVLAAYKYIPYMALELDAAALEILASLPQVVSIEEDIPVPPTLSNSVPVIGADQAWASGYTGAGQTVAILDTGVDTDHAAFVTGGSRIVSEACYSTTNALYSATTVCPGGVEETTAVGSGVDCTTAVGPTNTKAQSDCSHGTHVASIAAGNNGSNIVGVAPDANIIAVQVFSLFNSTTYCAGYSNCVLTFTSDQILGLERIYELRDSYNIASVNMSLGGGDYNAACDSDSRKAAIDNLRAVGIATVIASGNNGYRGSMSAPGCISSAISVGATDNLDNVASFSNIAPFIDLVAPGLNIYAAVPNGAGTKSGTSMATPHVTGAWAVFKQAVPNASVDDALAAFQVSGTLVDDLRISGTVTDMARINVDEAINGFVNGLTVDVAASRSYLLPDDTVTVAITVTNNTGVTANNVTLSAPVPAVFTLDNGSLSGDAAFANGTITWTTTQTLAVGQALVRTAVFNVKSSAVAGTTNLVATANSPDMDEARQGTAVLNINELVGCDFNDGFETGALSAAWETAVTNEGRVRVTADLPNSGSYSAVLDDSVAGSEVSEAALILTADLTGQAEVTLNFSWYDLGDEYHAEYDGVFVREQPGDTWVKAYDFAGSYHDAFQTGQVDLKEVATANGLALSERFQIKFGFYDNFSFNPSSISGGDGYAIDDVSFTCVPRGLALSQQVDNNHPQPGDAVNFQIIVTNNESITATNAVISFFLADGLLMNGEVVVDVGTAVSGSLGGAPPLVAQGLTIGPGEQVIITVPTIVSESLAPGTILENVLTVSSNEFGSPPPVTQEIVVQNNGFAVFIPLVTR
ncbi:MAG: S8 family serine peptidase [Ardenticatenaceae bacterium]|nr:S8 family serine peptidase [Ardenticatenaceae bacterium]MCB8975559.1 S8 family serine peptidase [Ardenticatenaceae bacterium]